MKALCIDKNFDFDFIADVEKTGNGAYKFSTDNSGYMDRIMYPKWIRNTAVHKQIILRGYCGSIDNRWGVLSLTEKECHNICRCIEILPQESFEVIDNMLSIKFN
jgi:hypothetical protein